LFQADKANSSNAVTVDQLRPERSGESIGQHIWIYPVIHQNSTVDDAFDYRDSHEIGLRSSDRILFPALTDERSDYRDNVKYVNGATGVAVAIGERVVALDVFDKPSTCRKVWDRILSGCILDASQAEAEEGQADAAKVERLLSSAEAADWQQVQPVGEGEEYRSEFEDDHASVLSFGSTIVHGSVVAQG